MHHFENKTRQGGSWSSPTGSSVSDGGWAVVVVVGLGEPPQWPRRAQPGPLGPINTSHSLEGAAPGAWDPPRPRAGGGGGVVQATCAASCAAPGGRSARRHGRTGGTGRVGGLCACGSGASVRRSARTSSRSRPSCSGRASRLQGGGESGPQFASQVLACGPGTHTLPATVTTGARAAYP